MKYFDSLPKVVYRDPNKVSTVYTNLLARASLVPTLMNNPLVFYTYDIQDQDTPESVAYKYYGDSYNYWIILYCNNILDPLWGWPLTQAQFQVYLEDKYTAATATYYNIDPSLVTDSQIIAYLYSQVNEYQKIITQTDLNSGTIVTNTMSVTQNTYNSLALTSAVYVLPTGPVSVQVSKTTQTLYDYEVAQNESKRNIKILNKTYVRQIEAELKKLMSK
jgi:hypothetical protein